MKLVALSDIHGHVASIPDVGADLAAADVVILSGDLTRFGRADAAAQVIETVRAFNPRILAVTGNCDHPECETYLEQEGIALHRRHVLIDGVAFLGVSGSLPCPMRTLQEVGDETLGQWLDDAARGLDPGIPAVLVSHEPPYNTIADHALYGGHAGSRALRKFIERVQPLICFTGHIHEGRGIDRIGNTPVVNPGAWMAGAYAVAEIDTTVKDLELRSVNPRK
jgi:hypothetical protein